MNSAFPSVSAKYKNGAIMVANQRMRGVCSLLEQCFLEPLRGGETIDKKEFAPQTAVPRAAARAASDANLKLSSYQKKLTGHGKGRYIHRQLEKMTSTGKRNKRVCVHPQSERMFELLQSLRLSVVESEFGVWWDQKRIATFLDMLAADAAKRYVPIELKTGYNTIGYLAPKYRLRGAKFRYRYCSERDKHFLQLLMGVINLNHSHPNVKCKDAYLIQLPSHTEAFAYSIPDWILESRESVEKCLATS